MNCDVSLAAGLLSGFRDILDTLIVLRTLSKGAAYKLIRISSREEERFLCWEREQAYTALTGEMLQERDIVDKQTRDAVKLS